MARIVNDNVISGYSRRNPKYAFLESLKSRVKRGEKTPITEPPQTGVPVVNPVAENAPEQPAVWGNSTFEQAKSNAYEQAKNNAYEQASATLEKLNRDKLAAKNAAMRKRTAII